MSAAPLNNLGLGTVALGRTAGLKYAATPRLPTDEEALLLLRTARDLGLALIDTAPAYGAAEQRLGELLPRVAAMNQWRISTKAGEKFDEATGASAYDFSEGAILRSIDGSLARLGVGCVEAVFLHFSSSSEDASVLARGEALGALVAAQAAGKCRATGVSAGTLAGALAAVESPDCDAVMLTLNANDGTFLPAIRAAAAAGKPVYIKKPLASGHADPAASLRMVLATAGVTAAVVGTTKPHHLEKLAEVARRSPR